MSCAAPELRATLGPLQRLELGELVDLYPGGELGPHPSAGSGMAVVDLDGDGLLDILLPQRGPTQVLLQGADGHFTDHAARLWPADDAEDTVAINTVDIDDDGDDDVFACREIGPNLFLENDGTGRLTDVSAQWGVDTQQRACFGAAFADMDADGDLDLLLANNDPCAEGPDGPDCEVLLEQDTAAVLWENVEGRAFQDVSDRLDHHTLLASLMSVISWVDLDQDGDQDILIANDARIEVDFAVPNVAYDNTGQGHFVDISEPSALDVRIESMGTAIGELNGDGRPDFLITGARELALLMSDEAGWYNADRTAGLQLTAPGHWFAWGADFGDLDNDGDLDLPVVFGWLPPDRSDDNPGEQEDALFIAEDGVFADEAAAWGWADPGPARGLAVVDLNGDGWLDLVKRELGGPLVVDLARCGAEAWLTVQLEQAGPNRDAVGAHIVVEAGAERHHRWVRRGGSSFATALPTRVHVGLGDAPQVDRIRITWPDGDQTELGPLATHRHLRVARP